MDKSVVTTADSIKLNILKHKLHSVKQPVTYIKKCTRSNATHFTDAITAVSVQHTAKNLQIGHGRDLASRAYTVPIGRKVERTSGAVVKKLRFTVYVRRFTLGAWGHYSIIIEQRISRVKPLPFCDRDKRKLRKG